LWDGGSGGWLGAENCTENFETFSRVNNGREMVEGKFLIGGGEVWFVVRGGGVGGGCGVDLGYWYEKARVEGDFDGKVKFREGLKEFENGGKVDFVSDGVLGGGVGGFGGVNRENVVRYCKEFIYGKRIASNSTSIIVTVLYIDLGSGDSYFIV
jgi:hypothetical protein